MITRSFLFSPGDSDRKLAKGATTSADAIIIDLEDAVALTQKEVARQTVRNALMSIEFGHRLRLVRINSVRTDMAWNDLEAVFGEFSTPDGIVIPKTESPEEIHMVREWLFNKGYLPQDIQLFALIESAMGILNLPKIASVKGLCGLMLGGEDFTASIGAAVTRSRHELLFARGALVTAAAAYGLQSIDTVYTRYQDVDGLIADTELIRDLGYTGKMCIHPIQVDPVNQVFRPSPQDVQRARSVLASYEKYLASGNGVFTFDGEMVDEATVKRYRWILARASAED